MTALAVDASVAPKWIFPDRDGEADIGQAPVVFEHTGMRMSGTVAAP
jgi:hypothetical protein